MVSFAKTVVALILVFSSSAIVEGRGKKKNGKSSKGKGKGSSGSSSDDSYLPDVSSYHCVFWCANRGVAYEDNPYEEVHTWTRIAPGMYNVLGDQNPFGGPYFNQSFTMSQSPWNEKHMIGVLHDRHEPDYLEGYPYEYEVYDVDEEGNVDGGDGPPLVYLQPPIGQFTARFKNKKEYSAVGTWTKPFAPHCCRFTSCKRID